MFPPSISVERVSGSPAGAVDTNCSSSCLSPLPAKDWDDGIALNGIGGRNNDLGLPLIVDLLASRTCAQKSDISGMGVKLEFRVDPAAGAEEVSPDPSPRSVTESVGGRGVYGGNDDGGGAGGEGLPKGSCSGWVGGGGSGRSRRGGVPEFTECGGENRLLVLLLARECRGA